MNSTPLERLLRLPLPFAIITCVATLKVQRNDRTFVYHHKRNVRSQRTMHCCNGAGRAVEVQLCRECIRTHSDPNLCNQFCTGCLADRLYVLLSPPPHVSWILFPGTACTINYALVVLNPAFTFLVCRHIRHLHGYIGPGVPSIKARQSRTCSLRGCAWVEGLFGHS
jgi:hypothetical protein